MVQTELFNERSVCTIVFWDAFRHAHDVAGDGHMYHGASVP